MVRRIELPSAAELFDDPAPRPGRVAAAAPAAQATVKARPARRRGRRSPSGAQLGERVATLQGRLADLPIASLLDLRDGLESLLAEDALDEAALAALLAPGTGSGL